MQNSRSGTTATCRGRAPSGQSDAEFWALSSWGDSSLKDTETLKLDLDLPTLDGLVSGTPGSAGWYVSDVTLTADASDATSGLDFAQVRVDGGGWINNSTTLSTDGQYSVEFHAQDMAGQSVSVPAADVWVDATPPDVSLTPSGTAGLAGWYVSDVDVTLAAGDATSGLSASQLQVDGGGWQAVGGVTLGEGVYTVDAEALDVAGNYNSTSLDVKVDTTAPALSVTESGTPGDGGWYTSPSVTVDASASDATSGVANIQMQTDGTGYASANSQTVSGEGAHSVDTTTSDVAGNSSSDSRTILIDSISPTLSLTSHNTSSIPDESGWVTVTGAVSDATSGPSSVQFSSDGGGSWDTVSVDSGGGFDIGWDSTSVRNGEVTLRVRPVDEAGNVGATTSFTVYVKNEKPYVSLPTGCVAVWDPYAIDAGGGSNPLDGLSVTVSDPENRWPARDYSFSAVPESWSWDRQFGDGTAAPPGEYDVTATARDTVSNTTTRTGCISIPDPEATIGAATTDTETTDPLDEDDSPTGSTPPDTTVDAPTLPSLQKAMADPTGEAVTTKIAAPESGAQIVEAARLALATAANAPAWGDAALFLAALATAYGLSRKQEREAEEAARLADLAMRAERRAMERHADDVMGGEVYVVQSGDSWFSIAGDVYGNQRMAGELMDANGGGGPLYPGDKILLPPKKKDEVADPYFSQKTWETAQAITATTQYGKNQAMEAMLKALASSEYSHQITQDGDPDLGKIQAIAALITNYRQSVQNGAMSVNDLQGVVETRLLNNLQADIQTAYAQTAGLDTVSTARALEAVYAAHGAKPPWEGSTYEIFRVEQLLDKLAQSSLAHQLLQEGDPNITAIQQAAAERAALLAQVEAGRLGVESVEQIVQAGILANLRADIYITEAGLDGQSIAERGAALEAVYASHGVQPPWAETGYTAYYAAQKANERGYQADAARYTGMADQAKADTIALLDAWLETQVAGLSGPNPEGQERIILEDYQRIKVMILSGTIPLVWGTASQEDTSPGLLARIGDQIMNAMADVLDTINVIATSRAVSPTGRGNYTSISIDRAKLPRYYKLFPRSVQNRTFIRQEIGGIPGTRYLASNLPPRFNFSTMFKRGVGPKAGIFAIAGSIISNGYEFLWGSDKGGDGYEFAGSTLVDVGINATIGIVTAAVVAAGVVVFTALTSVAVAPIAIVVATLALSMFVGYAVDYYLGDTISELKDGVTNGLRAWVGVADMVGEIVEHYSEDDDQLPIQNED